MLPTLLLTLGVGLPDAPLAQRHELVIELDFLEGELLANGEPAVLLTETDGYAVQRELAWVDRATEDGLERHYELVRGFLSGIADPSEDWDSPLSGARVLFGAEGEVPRWVDGEHELDESALRELLPSGGCAFLAPPPEAEPGARWSVELPSVEELLVPAGFVRLGEEPVRTWLGGGLSGFCLPPVPPPMPGWFRDAPGALELHWSEGQSRVARVELVLVLDATAHAASFVDALVADVGVDYEVERYDLEHELRLRGHYEWDLRSGRLLALEARGELRLELDALWIQSPPNGKEHELKSQPRFVGELSVSYEAHERTD